MFDCTTVVNYLWDSINHKSKCLINLYYTSTSYVCRYLTSINNDNVHIANCSWPNIVHMMTHFASGNISKRHLSFVIFFFGNSNNFLLNNSD